MDSAIIRITERPRPPLPEELQLRFSERAVKELEAIITHYPDRKSAMLPALWIAQREYGGHLTPEAIAEVAYRLGRSYAEVEGVATFYTMYNKTPVGKYMLEVCTNLTCMLCGGYRILEYLQQKLGIQLGETTPDGMFTLTEVECLNNCGDAPVMQVGDIYCRRLTPEKIDALLEELRQREEHTVVQLADAEVQLHLSEAEREAIQNS
ncbi:MAG: NADH-quinone oxidoreductase subunit NuoE [Fimbriimonadales bacterium]|mgnify:CR=1 FL=1|jgi:NADH-quinone oxidoreductase subunit E|nr:NADH-quinone oxidoreductase subunit NuoE [Armatimonadota bacterium]MCX7688070.1 NADH-quinone oxidoreductase subunit NuoE [Fimbriimonadales bacterium]CUU01677.1 NADH-quinone oxidoreductase subunit E [Armatimonadetes bacterium GBS]CUU35560.1 NADH-quinone oxidoreductase subunit E [Armatimonadetes bacterium GXS]CUU38395.1 NADH-quinone oxidoreductase subunit E [Armatimonadetes bacterium DC]GBC91258.1 NADH-quinone oxidoreductase subunit 2 [bacterium HR14]